MNSSMALPLITCFNVYFFESSHFLSIDIFTLRMECWSDKIKFLQGTLELLLLAEVYCLLSSLGCQVREKRPLSWLETHCVEHAQW